MYNEVNQFVFEFYFVSSLRCSSPVGVARHVSMCQKSVHPLGCPFDFLS